MENAQFKDILIELRESKGYTQEQLAKLLKISSSTIGMWETGKRTPTRAKYEAIADLFNVDIDYLYGRTSLKRKSIIDEYGAIYSAASGYSINDSGIISIPVLGRVAAGVPILAEENQIGTVNIEKSKAASSELFGLRIKGNSMSPRIQEGDIVIVRRQDDAESGDVVIALVNGDEAVCKKLQKYKEGISLISFNPSYEPMTYTDDDIRELPVKIIGKVIENRQFY